MNEEAIATNFLVTGTMMLGASLLFVTLFRKLGLGATLGYILGGALIGPYALGLVPDPEAVMQVTEIGIAFLLFLVGLELHPSRLWRLRKDIFGFGLVQVLLCGAGLSALMHLGFGLSIEASLAIGLPLALSSTAQVLPMLRSSGEMRTPHGERAFSVLLFQDLSIVPMITIVAAMSRAPADPSVPPGWVLALYTAGAIIGLVVAGRFLLNPLFRLIGRFGERELFIVAGLFAVVGSAALMHELHLSTALGAFVAGVVLAESPYRHELESDVDPFRSILLGLFFLSVGMLVDPGVIVRWPFYVIGIAAAIVAIKAVLIFAIARLFKMEKARAIWIGLLLSQGGEFGFVLFAQAEAARLIDPETASLFTAIVTLSMITTPFLMRLAEWLVNRPVRGEVNLDGPDRSPETNAIVVGYGRFGQTVAQMLMAKGVPVTIVDLKPAQIEISEEFGTKVYYGDGTRIDLLRTAGAETAQAILFCQDPHALTRSELAAVLEAFPQAAVLVRVFDRRQTMDFDGLNVGLFQRELFESAVVMGREALTCLGATRREAARVEAEYRRRDDERLQRQSETGDLHAAKEQIFTSERPLEDEPVTTGAPKESPG